VVGDAALKQTFVEGKKKERASPLFCAEHQALNKSAQG